jgi:putative hemin transport protein
MALTRNEHAVHERHGRFEEVSAGPGHILVTGPDIDLRLFTRRWAHAFAVAGERPSLQIFDVDGEAAHKIFATEHTDRAAWAALVERFTCLAAAAPPQAAPAPATAKAEAEVDGRALRSDWLALRDTHDFFGLLNRHKASRRQAFRLAGEDLALPLAPEAARTTLQLAAAREVPIMVFVGNRNAIQIHTGPVRRLAATPGWFNVLDPAFNLHLREAGVAEAWRVVKPTEDGAVTSIELLDAAARRSRCCSARASRARPSARTGAAWRATWRRRMRGRKRLDHPAASCKRPAGRARARACHDPAHRRRWRRGRGDALRAGAGGADLWRGFHRAAPHPAAGPAAARLPASALGRGRPLAPARHAGARA